MVLILIFLENALRLMETGTTLKFRVEVLILIFLENALRPGLVAYLVTFEAVVVLILIFLENALRPRISR